MCMVNGGLIGNVVFLRFSVLGMGLLMAPSFEEEVSCSPRYKLGKATL